ncbi:DUF916 and DUF3324 domain-containing protein [Vagococcus fluvialis]|uniref:DUF916 and DUF3324 domain-containing protein n=1 Tax=Vagococcus fluvialis TaxID=2738 RepID=UPI0028288DB2|nr:DUF916 and DUF3324 domain-containing protein [Vagococcus sp.]
MGKKMCRNKRIQLWLSSLILLLSGVLFFSSTAVADETDSGMGFSVSPILPTTQIDLDLGYYYLKTEPNKEQTIEVKLSSQKDEKQTIEMFVQDAYTGSNGGLTYGLDGEDDFKQDETLVNPTSQIVLPKTETIELQPREEKVVSFTVKPPVDSYDGVKIGRLVFKPTVDKDNKTAIVDEYQYAISILLSESGDEHTNGELANLNLNEVKPTIKRGKRLVTANLQNPEPKRMMGIDLQGTVTKKGSDKVVKQTKISDFQFAPNSNVDLEVDWGLSELSPGEYTMTILAKNSYDDIHLTKDFRITGDEAKSLNKESAFKINTPTWVKAVAISSAFLSLILAIIISVRNSKWKKLAKRRKKNKKRNKRH